MELTVNGEKRTVNKPVKLSDVVSAPTPCGGHGTCGKCKVVAKGDLSSYTETELRLLTEAERARGVRLACQTTVLGNAAVETLTGSGGDVVLTTDGVNAPALPPLERGLAVAVDVGTTTLAARLIGENGETLADGGRLNPQTSFGADVLSRVEKALHGKADDLKNAVLSGINETVKDLLKKANRKAVDIKSAAITGNTAMLYLLTGTDVTPLSRAPFEISERFGKTFLSGALGLTALSENTPVYLPPCVSAFVGADLTCAILAAGFQNGGAPRLLVDVGTNGETALTANGRLYVCSTAAGPAFEGVGISQGMRGAVGAIDRVWLEKEKLCTHVLGEVPEQGVCGSGLVDAVAAFLKRGDIDETGATEKDALSITPRVSLTKKDIRAVQLGKSAICAGIRTLLRTARITETSLSSFYVAGGFGAYLNKENAVRIGLFPEGVKDCLSVLGNAALSGAVKLLTDASATASAERLAKTAELIDLNKSATFNDLFVEEMFF